VSLVAVVGDGCTTTALGIAAAWSRNEQCVVAEFDPAGGCLSAWLDLPRSPGLAEVVASSTTGTWPVIEVAIQRARSGVDVLLAPTRAVEAVAVIHAATTSVLPVLGAIESPVVVADGGRLRGPLSVLTIQADVVVIAHQQNSGSCAAAVVGFERVAELAALLTARSIPTVVALIGQRPYAADEVTDFVEADAVVALADDAWAAAILAGRAGSAARLSRSPLMRSCNELAAVVSTHLLHARLHKSVPTSLGRLVDDRR
jgi:MinD-like ATPase involved in chromosome partitioning or flagellar assembly